MSEKMQMGSREYDFQGQSKIGTRFEEKLDRHFGFRYVIQKADKRDQQMGIDRFFSEKLRSERGLKTEFRRLRFSVEYKADYVVERSGDVFLEVDQVIRGKKQLGWALKFYAQVLILYLPKSGTALWLNSMNLKSAMAHWLEVFSLSDWVSNRDGNTARGVLVPLADFVTACSFGRERIRE